MIIKESVNIGGREITIETGRIAKQSSAVLIGIDETLALVTAVAEKKAGEGTDFFPLTCHYTERLSNRLPGRTV